MATATAEKPAGAPPANPYAPVNLMERDAEKAARAAARKAKQPVLRKCLDAQEAARFEAKKPSFDYEVSVVITRPDDKGRMKSQSHKATVSAQNETEAWAKFCDAIGEYPSPHSCSEREINKLGKATA